jgi:hypothetical protein
MEKEYTAMTGALCHSLICAQIADLVSVAGLEAWSLRWFVVSHPSLQHDEATLLNIEHIMFPEQLGEMDRGYAWWRIDE